MSHDAQVVPTSCGDVGALRTLFLSDTIDYLVILLVRSCTFLPELFRLARLNHLEGEVAHVLARTTLSSCKFKCRKDP